MHDRLYLNSVKDQMNDLSGTLKLFHLRSLRSLLQLLMNEVDFLESLATLEGTETEMGLERRLELCEIDLIREALHRAKGHQVRAAKILDVRTNTLNAKLKRFGIDPRLFIQTEESEEIEVDDCILLSEDIDRAETNANI